MGCGGGGRRGWDPVLARGLVLRGSGRAFGGGTCGTDMKGFGGVKRIVRKMLFLTPVQVCCHKNAERSIRLQQLGLNAGSRCRGHINLCLPPVFNWGNQRCSRTHCCVQCCFKYQHITTNPSQRKIAPRLGISSMPSRKGPVNIF